MLCPDVWNLPQPTYNKAIIRGQRDAFRKKVASGGNFSEFITLVVPGNFPTPESADSVLLGSDSYIVRKLPLSELLVPEFLEAFVKKVCEINLRDGALLKDTTYRKNILKSLCSDLIPPMDIKISWTPPSARFCPSSVAKYFSDRKFSVELCPTKKIQREVFPGRIPEMIVAEEGNAFSKEDFEDRVVDFLEFIGLLALNCSTSSDEYLSSYEYSGSMIETEKVTVIKWKGFFTKHILQRISHYLALYLKRFPTIPWIVMNVEKTSFTPFTDAFTDQTFSITNDSSYALILSPRQNFILHQIIPIDKKF
uniref:Uncharacterized protein n=1 Tax=Lutzomyia longipalpis TaxID=7200 RepID=A0A1B0CBB8_LUTLO